MNKCDHCGQMDYRNAKLKQMLLWLLNWLKDVTSADGDNMLTTILHENCELDSWYKDNRRAYEAELKRKQEEIEKEQKIRNALSKLTTEEKVLLKLPLLRS